MNTVTEKRSIPFLALGGVWEEDDIAAVTKVMRAAGAPGGNFFPLPEEEQFQDALARHEEAAAAVVVNSCGTALDLCMMALGIQRGDEVIVPGLTFVCTAGTAASRGAKIVFADVDPATLCLSPDAVSAKITGRTKAIIPVHYAGHPCDIDAFEALAKKTGIPVVYDAAHAIGARYLGRGIGGVGTASCYSFQSNKNMTCLGEGGAVTTNDRALGEKVRGLKTFGYVYSPQLRVTQIGHNYRMTKPQCAVGVTQLSKIDSVIARRLKLFQQMQTALRDVPELTLPAGVSAGHGCHLYVIRTNSERFERAEFLRRLKSEWSVGCVTQYPAVWTWEAFSSVEYDNRETQVTARAVKEVVSLPLFPSTTEEDVEYIARAIKEIIAALTRT